MPFLDDELFSFLKSNDASLVGFADLKEIDVESRDGFPIGISIAVALDPQIIAGIQDGPNPAYFKEYQRANRLLDEIGRKAAKFLKEKGYQAVSSATTNSGMDPQTFSTKLPHKTVATRAGLGWIGKCALLVNKKYGSAIRLNTILTDAPLTCGKPINESLCAHCTHCADACPGNAVSDQNWYVGIPRESLYDFLACRETAHEFEKKRPGVSNNICGICIVACPWTQDYLKRAT